METICMKCQIMFSEKKKNKKISLISYLLNLPISGSFVIQSRLETYHNSVAESVSGNVNEK